MMTTARKIDVVTNVHKKAMIDLGWNFVGEDSFDDFNRLKFTPANPPKEGEPKSVDLLFIRKDSPLMTEIGYLDVSVDLISSATIIVNISQKLNLPYSPFGKDKRKDNFLYDPEGYLNNDMTPKSVLDEDVLSSLLQVKIASFGQIEEIKAARKAGTARSQLMTKRVVVKRPVEQKKDEGKVEEKQEGKLASLLKFKPKPVEKPEEKADENSAVKLEIKPEVKPEAKEAKEAKPEQKIELKPKVEPKAEVKPETKIEPKPEPKHEEKKVVIEVPKEEKAPEGKVAPLEKETEAEKGALGPEAHVPHVEDDREPHIQLAVLLAIVVVIAIVVSFMKF